MLRLWVFLFTVLIAAPSLVQVAGAQDVGAQDAGPMRVEYEALAQTRGIETEFYQRQAGEVARAEPGQGEGAPVSGSTQFEGGSVASWVSGILITLIIVGFVVLLIQNAGQLRSDRATKKGQQAKKIAKRQPPQADEVAKRAAAYAARGDRLAAVEDMLAEALARAEAELDLIFGEADTARELERRLRPLWTHSKPLQRLVRASERSQFAGETLSVQDYGDCLSAYKRIMGQGA